VFKNFNPKVKQQLSGLFRSVAEKLESDSDAKVQGKTPSDAQPTLQEQLESQIDSTGETKLPPETQQKSESDSDPAAQPDSKPRLREKLTRLPAQIKELSRQTFHNRRPRFWIGLGMGASLSSGAIAIGVVLFQLESNIPGSADDILTYSRPGTITIKASNGTVLQEIGAVTHEKLKRWQIPDIVSKAFIASEDRRFQEHRKSR
jgi:penicillin-binding protein 1A